MKSLVIPDRPLMLLPRLALDLGVDAAIVYQQLYWLIECDKNGKVLSDGNRYIFNTYEEWRNSYFPFFSERTIQRIMLELESSGLIETRQPEGTVSRRKYYRVTEGGLAHLTEERAKERQSERAKNGSSGMVPELDDPIVPETVVPLTETTAKTTTKKVCVPKTSESEKIARLQLPFESDAFKKAWGRWTLYLGASNDSRRAYRLLCEMFPWGEERAICAIEKAIDQKWQKPFEPNERDLVFYRPQKERIPDNVRAIMEAQDK